MQFALIMRAYAPFDTFGFTFHGDGANRGPTTSNSVTSRMISWVVFDPMSGVFEKPNGRSDESKWAYIFSARDRAIPVVRLDSQKLGPNWVHFRMHAAASNPLIPPKGKLAPDIDLHCSITVAVGQGRLNVNADLTGDTFPNAEVMLEDESGTRRMNFSAETTGGRHTGPFVRLPGSGNAAMNAICRSFSTSESGQFI